MNSDTNIFSSKHPGDNPDNEIMTEITKYSENKDISCASVFKIAKQLGQAVSVIGKNVDLMNVRLTKCQLGLFGYTPDKKIVKPVDHISDELKDMVQSRSSDGTLSCEDVWSIAAELNIPKMEISNLCEFLGLKIKPCQLGAF